MNKKDGLGRTLLHWAVINNNLKEVKRLVTEGTSVLVKDRSGATPYGLSIRMNHPKVAAYLLKVIKKLD